ncbi:MAG: 4-vinyl reductase [Peptococcaceae bacterium]|nr:4-vinyl reductase [Peptococcaceae bacterium]
MPSRQYRSLVEYLDLENVNLGRPNLGQDVPVLVYRLMQYTLRDQIAAEYGEAVARKLFYQAGKAAGESFCRNFLNVNLDLSTFVTELKDKLIEMKIGVLRIEELDPDNLNIVLSVAEDLDCSGLPIIGDTVCDYDEGFLAGILKVYTGKDLKVKEVDCWANGARVCRFQINQ